MSDSLAPSWVVAKITDVGACRRNSAGKRKMPARFVATAVVLAALFNCNVALAQVDTPFDGTVTPTPMIGATSPLGVTSGSGASPAGIPLGSTEIASPGVSPVPTGVTGTITIPTTSSSTACPTVATSPSEMFGSTASFDGGGLAMGTAAPATAANSGATAMSPASTMSATSSTSGVPVTSGSSGTLDTSGMSGMCGSGSSSLAHRPRHLRLRPPHRAASLALEFRSDRSRSPISALARRRQCRCRACCPRRARWRRLRWRQRCPPSRRQPYPRRRQAIRRARTPGAAVSEASPAPAPPGLPEPRSRRDCRDNPFSVNDHEIFAHCFHWLPSAVMRPLISQSLRCDWRCFMRPLLIIATVGPMLYFSPGFAQVGTTMPSLGATSSLGADPSAPVGMNGLAPGASTPVSPVPNGVTGTVTVPSTSSGAGACSTLATSPTGTFGSPATYDGGGMAMATGTTTPATAGTTGGAAPSGISTSTAIAATSGETTSSGMPETSGLTGMCGSGSSGITASSNPTSTSSTTSSSSARAGIPLGSYEIGNLGVSAATAVPTPSVSPFTSTVGPSAPVPTMPTVPPTTGSTIP